MDISILIGIMVAGLVACVYLFFQQRKSPISKRLETVELAKPEMLVKTRKEEYLFLPPTVVKSAEEKLGLGKESPKMKELKKTLVRAGFDAERAMPYAMGLKLGLPIALPLFIVGFSSLRHSSWLIIVVAFYLFLVLGYYLPDLVLGRLVDHRQKKIKEGLPDALDLMVVCVEAGQGMNAAIKRVGDEMMLSNKTLAKELLMVNLEMNAGVAREQALRNLGERTGVEDMISLCNVLIQADRFGTSIAQTLRVHSEIMRTTRRQRLEELANKTPVKLVFPLILFIFPAIMVVILGPAVISIYENLLKK